MEKFVRMEIGTNKVSQSIVLTPPPLIQVQKSATQTVIYGTTMYA